MNKQIISGTNVNAFIGTIQLADNFNEDAKIIEARGYRAIWSDAIAGEGSIIGEDNIIRNIKIFAVPFSDANGIHKNSIIGGILQPEDRIQIHRFITIADDIDHDMIAGIGSSIEREQQDSGIEPLIHAIQIGSRSDIWSIILGGTIPSRAIQTAFETSGIAYNAAPISFPDKSIWYAATCIQGAR